MICVVCVTYQESVRQGSVGVITIMCDESGHTEFPFLYLEHVKLLTPAQVRLNPCSGFAQAGSPLARAP